MRELEEEVEALQAGRAHRASLMALMEKKALVGDLFNQLRLARAPGAAWPGDAPSVVVNGRGMEPHCGQWV